MADVDKFFQNQTWLKLFQAIKNNNIEQVNFLLAAECIEDRFINLALLNAARYGRVEIVQLLIDSGANANRIFGSGTALTEAIEGEYIEIIDILLDKGADCNIPYYGEVDPPLFIAIDKGNLEIVKKLIKAGANVNARDEEGWTPLMFAVNSPARMEITRIGRLQGVQQLLEAGAEVNTQNNEGMTALMLAAQSGKAQMIGILVEANADINLTDKKGKTALDYAREETHQHSFFSEGVDYNESIKCDSFSRKLG